MFYSKNKKGQNIKVVKCDQRTVLKLFLKYFEAFELVFSYPSLKEPKTEHYSIVKTFSSEVHFKDSV